MAEIGISDLAVFWAVVLARFFVPLYILRYPLPAILVALVVENTQALVASESRTVRRFLETE